MDKEDIGIKRRHTGSHVMTFAVKMTFPEIDLKLGVGPWTDTEFYQDFDFGDHKISDSDFKKIEKKMRWIVNKNFKTDKKKFSEKEARNIWKDDPYKLELIDGIVEKGEEISAYDFTDDSGNVVYRDICAGPHLKSTGDLGVFKLTRIAGSYWRGDENRPMLTRIYGVAFENDEELKAYEYMLEEAAKRDHRKLGKELDLFAFDEEIGPGLPLWLPKGNVIKDILEDWAKKTEREWGYQRVTTPVLTKENLFYTSGHLPLYKDSMYAPIKIEEENYYIKPMNCPFHHKVFSARPRSYKDLPLRLAEYGICHRYEDSGSLFGLMRVRGMCMNDAHIYCSMEDAIEEFIQVIRLHEYYYKELGINEYRMELALRDPKKMDKYHGEEEDWVLAEKMSLEAMEKSGVPFTVMHEGAAFYGPKMDFQIKSSIGREFTASTNQLDLHMGKKFNLEFINKKGEKETPVIIHRAPLGTHERFIGFLIEHYAGAFPAWLAPVQAYILPVAKDHEKFAAELLEKIRKQGGRAELHKAEETLGKRIRQSQTHKVPFSVIVGDEEVKNKSVTMRKYGEEKDQKMKMEVFLKLLSD
ncbi:threonine--tRNA ligase [Candidatus Gracilibacteria bacterium]|nr:threonine--tRNA ligase [Candidatus Gracilibacteria bacterium]